jgi:hypothetical protein
LKRVSQRGQQKISNHSKGFHSLAIEMNLFLPPPIRTLYSQLFSV